MARLTEKQKELILADYDTGKYSQRQLSKKHDVSIGTVNKLTKEVQPQNEHLVNAQVAILSAKALLSDEQMNAIMNTAKDELLNRGLVENATQLNLVRTTEYLANNKKLEKVNVGGGIQDLVEVGLASDDFKQCQDAIDKASITLGVNQRGASTQITNNNAQQNNETKVITHEYK